MTSRAATEWRYEKLTWPEINETIEMRKVCIIPCGAVEQHGPHLPLDVDLMCPGGIARGVGEAMRDKVLVLPTIAYGYTGHVMDFPGTIKHTLGDLHQASARRDEVARVPRLQKNHPAQRPRLEHAEP